MENESLHPVAQEDLQAQIWGLKFAWLPPWKWAWGWHQSISFTPQQQLLSKDTNHFVQPLMNPFSRRPVTTVAVDAGSVSLSGTSAPCLWLTTWYSFPHLGNVNNSLGSVNPKITWVIPVCINGRISLKFSACEWVSHGLAHRAQASHWRRELPSSSAGCVQWRIWKETQN